MNWFLDILHGLQSGLFESLVQPTLFAIGLSHLAEEAFEATYWFVIGLCELLLIAVFMFTAERWFPAEPVTDRATIWTDIFYTVLHRLGFFSLIVFLLLEPLLLTAQGQVTLLGLQAFQLDFIWPGVTDIAWVSFLLYLVVLDFVDYWIHRAQHFFGTWWQLHALHHAQRQMTVWSDNRNHLLDDLARDLIMAVLAILIGVAPGQFIFLIALSRIMQSLQHANVRWHFGWFFERVLVSPSFHRLHHAIGYGHEGLKHGCNFGVIFSVWDIVFRTADFRLGFVPTGIRDQLDGREYGKTFVQQQWLGVKRLFRQA
jgi:sterol desaturase/sphingolipid hydroxylase (fatty acid hydroxylase superfamily)